MPAVADIPPRTYRPDIDGLRAIAVLAVVIFHAFPEAIPGGFIGVDIFFVISGYLISGIIRGDLERGTFSLAAFYRRRIHRIFPALLVVLAACLSLGAFLLLTDDVGKLARSTVFATLFSENLALWLDSGYFDGTSWQKPLLHLWSLAVEEQFYIAYPLLCLALWRRSWRLTATVMICALASFVLNVLFVGTHGALVFYCPLTRAWELLCGCLLAGLPARALPRAQSHLAHGMSLLGLAAISCAAFGYDAGMDYPGIRAAIPVIGAALMIAAGPGAAANRWLLANPVMVFIGLISYPFYLWHWPALSLHHLILAKDGTPDVPTVAERLDLVVISFLLAYLTYLLLEKRIRHARSPLATSGLAGVAVALTAIGWWMAADTSADPGDRLWYSDKVLRAKEDWDLVPPTSTLGERAIVSAGGDGPRTLYWGDSHMEQYLPRIIDLAKAQPAHGRGVEFLTFHGTAPIPGLVASHMPDYLPYATNTATFLTLAADPKVDTVVLTARWSYYFRSENSLFYHFRNGDTDEAIDADPGRQHALDAFDRLIADLAARKTVYLVLDTPFGDALDPHYIFRRTADRNRYSLRTEGARTADVLAEDGAMRDFLTATARKYGAHVIDPLPCFAHGPVIPSITPDNQSIFKDHDHLRASYVRNHVRYLDVTVAAPPPASATAAAPAPSHM